ncbi:MAG: TRAP transporter substrate-binding protein DctP [Bradyrhizobium sp.]|uniref:TRAP transporter substrate-binding protein DctP n=1 Tax=Bradyrhizobium sp. TaxID=376 RepID=UPI001D723D15|nr:TRAP transporter substrate-binding protein DctP [Bradyrhizobium sp.]MBV9563922.1 TRAP transporter substrate-binding protein DctP [Bradyrhizobium sp.]
MTRPWSRRQFVASALTVVAAPALRVAAAGADEPMLLRCSLETPPSHTRNVVMRDYLGRVEQASGGRIRTQLFESGQLFPDLQVGKALLQGQIEMGMPGTFSLTGVIPDADFIQLPVLYGRPIDMLHAVIDGKSGKLLGDQIEARLNAHVLGPWLDLGFFNWYSTSKPLNSYDDLKGMKIRNNGGAGQAWRTQFMGAIPNTTPLPNVPLALSQGTFDGLITSHETVASGQFWESGIRHALEDHQFVGEYVPMVRLAFWQKLPAELQTLLAELWRANIATYRASMASAQARARETAQAHGITIVTPNAEELAAKREAMMKFQDNVAMLSRISPELVAAVANEAS